MTDHILPPVQGEGQRNGHTPRDIPDGYISWEEHYEAWENYHKRYKGQSAETIANRGGFGYLELKEYLGRNPKTWVPRNLEKYGGFVRDAQDLPADEIEDDPPAAPSILRSHIWFVENEMPICKTPEGAPEGPFNFDGEEAAHCSKCLLKLHKWAALWVNGQIE